MDKNNIFVKAEKLSEFNPDDHQYDISICVETLEHLPRIDIDQYIEKLYAATSTYCHVTIPNKKKE